MGHAGFTREEFEAYYARNSQTTTRDLWSQGLVAVPCHGERSNCDYEDCRGWSMLTRASLQHPVLREMHGLDDNDIAAALAAHPDWPVEEWALR